MRLWLHILLGVALLVVAASGWAYHLTRPEPEAVVEDVPEATFPLVRLPGVYADAYHPVEFSTLPGRWLVLVLDTSGPVQLPIDSTWMGALSVEPGAWQLCRDGVCENLVMP